MGIFSQPWVSRSSTIQNEMHVVSLIGRCNLQGCDPEIRHQYLRYLFSRDLQYQLWVQSDSLQAFQCLLIFTPALTHVDPFAPHTMALTARNSQLSQVTRSVQNSSAQDRTQSLSSGNARRGSTAPASNNATSSLPSDCKSNGSKTEVERMPSNGNLKHTESSTKSGDEPAKDSNHSQGPAPAAHDTEHDASKRDTTTSEPPSDESILTKDVNSDGPTPSSSHQDSDKDFSLEYVRLLEQRLRIVEDQLRQNQNKDSYASSIKHFE
jgi:hypothetical protein